MIALLLKKLELCSPPSQEELDRHFYRLIKRYHPDRNPENQDWANQKSREIIAAYRDLKKSLRNNNSISSYSAFGHVPAYKSRSQHYKGKTAQERLVSFQVLKGQANCLIPLAAVYQVNCIEELRSGNAFLPKPKELLYLSGNGQIRQASHSELLFAEPDQILFWIFPEDKKKALLLDPIWEMAKQIQLDICNTPMLPSAEAKGVRIYYKNEIFYCPAELVFQMHSSQPQIAKNPKQ